MISIKLSKNFVNIVLQLQTILARICLLVLCLFSNLAKKKIKFYFILKQTPCVKASISVKEKNYFDD